MAFLPNGDLAVATGVDGKLFRVTPKGEGKVFFDSPETHLRSLAVKNDGTILAGGSAKGRIYEIRPDGAAHALYDSPLSEISSIYVDANGIGWAAAASNVLPSTAPVKATPAKPAAQSGTASTSATATAGEQNGETVVVLHGGRGIGDHRRGGQHQAQRRLPPANARRNGDANDHEE